MNLSQPKKNICLRVNKFNKCSSRTNLMDKKGKGKEKELFASIGAQVALPSTHL